MSRSLKPIPNTYVQSCIGRPEYNYLDGELIVGNPFAVDCYRTTASSVMSRDGQPHFTFHVFDRIDMVDAPFSERFSTLTEMPFVKVVPHLMVTTEDQLLEIESTLLAKGAEGVMVRSLDGHYKFGRSTLKEGLLGKLKRMSSSEAVIEEVVELERNLNEAKINELGHTERSSAKEGKIGGGTMGALLVRDIETGVLFSIGTGFTADDRNAIWVDRDSMAGKIITYNHFSIGNYDKPRFPSFKGFRAEEDM